MIVDGYYLGFAQILVPMLAVGALTTGFLLFGYMSLRYRNPLYFSIVINTASTMLFSIFEIGVLYAVWIAGNRTLGFQFNRLQQLTVVVFIWSMFFMLNQVLELRPIWKKVNRILTWIAGGVVVSIIAGAFLKPELFVSLKEPITIDIRNYADTCRGKVGILYMIRDGILVGMILYHFASIVIDQILNRRGKQLLFPLLGILIAILCGLSDLYFMRYGVNPLFHFPLSRFPVGAAIMVIFFMSTVFVDFLNKEKALYEIQDTLGTMEKKNTLLLEGAFEAVFILSSDLKLLSANRNARKLFFLKMKDLSNVHFPDLFHHEADNGKFLKQLVEEKLRSLNQKGEAVSFIAPVNNPFTGEGKEYKFSFEMFKVKNRHEYIGRVNSVIDSLVAQCTQEESLKLSIGNHLVDLDEICTRLTANLGNHLSAEEISMVNLGLMELLINAIEHGNLEISYEMKQEALKTNQYSALIVERQTHPEYASRTVNISYSLTPEAVLYCISDQGNGFDYGKYGHFEQVLYRDSPERKGRGLFMVQNAFDNIEFRDRGSTVCVRKDFPKS